MITTPSALAASNLGEASLEMGGRMCVRACIRVSCVSCVVCRVSRVCVCVPRVHVCGYCLGILKNSVLWCEQTGTRKFEAPYLVTSKGA